MHLYIDDLSEEEAINLKKDLVFDPVQRQAPLTFNVRTQKILPPENSILQKNLLKLEAFTDQNLMVINEKRLTLCFFTSLENIHFYQSIHSEPEIFLK